MRKSQRITDKKGGTKVINSPQGKKDNQLLQRAEKLWRSGDRMQAQAIVKQMLVNSPNNAPALHLDAILTLELGNPSQAARIIEKAVIADKRDPDISLNHGNILNTIGDFEKAEQAFRKALKRRPNFPQANNGLGMALSGQKRHQEAVRYYQLAIKQMPNFTPASVNLGAAYLEMSEPHRAIDVLEAARKLNPSGSSLQKNLIIAYIKAERSVEIIDLLQNAAAMNPDKPINWINLGIALGSSGDCKQAFKAISRALDLEPGSPVALYHLARTHQKSGDFAEATRYYEKVQNLLRESDETVDVDLMQKTAFRIADTYEQRRDYASAFEAYDKANSLKTDQFNQQEHAALIEKIIERFQADPSQNAKNTQREPIAHIFVIGLPRSGKSTLERLLCDNEHIFGLGERSFLKSNSTQDKVTHLSAEYHDKVGHSDLKRLSTSYRNECTSLLNGEAFAVNTLPLNYLFLGYIRQAFPAATIIHCQRDPLDTLLACYFKFFDSNLYAWSSNFGDLLFYYNQYQRIMSHWNIIGIPILNVQYEDLVRKPDEKIQEILDCLGVDGDFNSNRSHLSKRNLVENAQEHRKPLSDEFIGVWQHYKQYIFPLIDNLDVDNSE